jgi:hypothetical protein
MSDIDTMLTTEPEVSLVPSHKAKANLDAHQTADALSLLREWAKVFTLTATSCACCGKDLRDAVSVTQGIGPDCSRQHYAIDFDITETMVMEALGRLFASHLDDRIKQAVRNLKDKPRDLCNVLVWWCSVHLNNIEVVLECAEVVSLLGFESLGNRLRERNTNVVVSKTTDGNFIVRCRAKSNLIDNMRRVREATPVAREGRFKYGWKFPPERRELVWTILGEGFGGQWATVPAKDTGPSRVVKVDLKSQWDVVRAIDATYNPPKPVTHVRGQVAPPPVPPTIVRLNGTGIEVYTPNRNWQFVAELKLLPYADRRWDGTTNCWRVASKHEQRVRELVKTHFNGAV